MPQAGSNSSELAIIQVDALLRLATLVRRFRDRTIVTGGDEPCRPPTLSPPDDRDLVDDSAGQPDASGLLVGRVGGTSRDRGRRREA
jgi:hypothetical protein